MMISTLRTAGACFATPIIVMAQRRRIALLTAISILGFLLFWNFRVTGQISWQIFSALTLFVLLCLVYGKIFFKITRRYIGNIESVSFIFLTGFFLFNSLLFLLALITPLGLWINIILLSFGGLIILMMTEKVEIRIYEDHRELADFLCVVFVGIATTLWCTDIQSQKNATGVQIVFTAWQDVFFHVRQISVFANSYGVKSIQDIGMSGVQAPIYHYASYLSSAAVALMSGVAAIDIYSSFLLPLGIFLTGIAAYSLIASLWGSWAGLAAALAIVMLPDAYQQGFGNRYLSYNFLSQINLGMLYGIACISIAWIFILQGCQRSKIGAILIGYLFLGLCLFYKAHIFVANSYLILIYPCLFYKNLNWRKRSLFLIAFSAIFFSAVGLSQLSERVPVLRLDGSGIGKYIIQLLLDYDEGFLKTFFTKVFRFESHSKPVEALYAVAMLSISTLGVWVFLTPLVLLIGRRRLQVSLIAFPLLIVGNYLLMTLGLAGDSRGVGTFDELLNRPLVWAYFAVVVWTVGASVYLVTPHVTAVSRSGQLAFLALLPLLLSGPLIFSKNLQTFPTRNGFDSYEKFNSVPTCLVRSSQFIRSNSQAEDLVQSSDNDRRFAVTALTERQRYAGVNMFSKPSKALQDRLDALERLKGITDAKDVLAYAALHRIDWYILHPGTVVGWPEDLLKLAQFECDGYKVFHLTELPR